MNALQIDKDQPGDENKNSIKQYLAENRKNLSAQYGLPLSSFRIDKIAGYYNDNVTEIGAALKKIKSYYDKIKKIEIDFYNKHDINFVLEDDAVDYILDSLISGAMNVKTVYDKLTADLEYGLRLIHEKTNMNRFFIPKSGLITPELFLEQLIKTEFNKNKTTSAQTIGQPVPISDDSYQP